MPTIASVPRIAAIKVDLDKKTATVQGDPGKAHVATMVRATIHAGFPSAAQD